MSTYEMWSLILTGIYNLLTFGLLAFVAYETLVKPRQPNIAFYLQGVSDDTEQWSWRRPLADFVLENKGGTLKNVVIKSEPDFIGWDNLGKDNHRPPRSTSDYFKQPIPFFSENERHQFFWCDMEANSEVCKMPFTIIIEFDNPILPYPRTRKLEFYFDLSTFDGTIFGLNTKYDIHNVALETSRIRNEIKEIRNLINTAIISKKNQNTNSPHA
ncbi:hypothetical protein [Geothrix fermentans]|uniref:hypothetical protein n=1 Tax=Geothrix fermentans TaxID=44676 RepID=UPI0012FAF089|nr:hypothetical protein [Geothrix fermentans]